MTALAGTAGRGLGGARGALPAFIGGASNNWVLCGGHGKTAAFCKLKTGFDCRGSKRREEETYCSRATFVGSVVPQFQEFRH